MDNNYNEKSIEHFVPKQIIAKIMERMNRMEESYDPSIHKIPNEISDESLQKFYHSLIYIPPELNNIYQELAEDMNGISSKEWQESIKNLSYLNFNLDLVINQKTEKKQFLEIADNTKQLIKGIYNDNNQLVKVNPREFEKIIAELLHNKGYEVELTKRTRDGGYDIIALTKMGTIPFKLIAECKRSSKTVGVGIIRNFCDVINTEKVNKGIMFATSYYSKPAKIRKNQMGALLDLQDRDQVLEWIIDYMGNLKK